MRSTQSSLVLAVLLAGCFGGNGGGGGDGEPNGDGGTTAPPTDPIPETDNAILYVEFDAGSGATLHVPFPTLDACMTPEDWMAGDAEGANVTATLANAAQGRTGRVVALAAQGQSSWSMQVPLKAPCQPFQYDPWSIDPDAPEDTLEVRAAAGSVGAISAVVRWVRGDCGNATLYEGSGVGAEWTQLGGRSIPVANC